MAEPTAAPATSGQSSEARVDIKIISPGSDNVRESIEIRDVPVSTQVSKVKERIQTLAPGNPAPEAQRLIYQGHVLADPSATLERVFGADAIRDNRRFIIHFVPRPATVHVPSIFGGSQRASRSSTPVQTPYVNGPPGSIGNPPAIANPSSNPPPTPFRYTGTTTRGVDPRAIPGGIPQGGHGSSNEEQGHHGQHDASVGQGDGPPFVHPPQPGLPPGFPPQVQLPFGMVPNMHIAQHAPAMPMPRPYQGGQAGQAGQEAPTAQADQMREHNVQPEQPAQAQTQVPGQPQQPQPQHQGMPHNIRYQMTYQTFAVPPGQPMQLPPGFPMVPGFGPGQQMQHQVAHQNQAAADLLHQQHVLQHQQQLAANQRRQMDIARYQHSIRERQQQRAQTGTGQDTNASNGGHPGPQLSGVDSVPHESTQASSQQAMTTQPMSLSTPTVYLLQAPSGPHAILFHPQGVFNSTEPQIGLPGLPGLPLTGNLNRTERNTPSPFRPTPTATTPAATQANQQPNHAQQDGAQDAMQAAAVPPAAAVAPPAAAQRPANANGEPDLLGPLQPLLAQLWLLLRVLLFAYFFLGGELGWRRPLILLGICLTFLLLRNLGEPFQNRIRNWWEGIVGIPARPRENQNQNQNQNQAQGQAQGQGQAQDQAQAQPQQRQELGPWRATLRPLERAVALFIASLWPGLGERTVRARREEDERVVREREEAERQAAEQQSLIEQGPAAEGEASAAQAQESNQTAEVTGAVGASSTDEAASSGVQPADSEGAEIRERRKGGVEAHTEGSCTVETEASVAQENSVGQEGSHEHHS
ncbi:hypothetical protein MBLNU457_g0034t1 [Dothideomycetes sp. NU457]